MRAPLIYIVGASGSGKDSLMQYARGRLAGEGAVCFAHRYVTRRHDAGGENHIGLTEEEFSTRQAAGLFALSWESHGLFYGIGIEINQWAAKGITVIVNGSRAYLAEASRRYAGLLPVWIEVSPEALRERLLARGRESVEVVEARLRRHRTLYRGNLGGEVIRNDGPLAEAGEALVRLIRCSSGAVTCA
jgi:ribose 1,5-bisphosphokinase